MTKIKILQFPIANSKGGITHYALDNWKWMDKRKFRCDFVTMSKKLDFADEILATGSKIFYISCYAEQNKEQFVKEFDKILSEGYDVVHLHTKQWKSFLVEELCKKHGIPKIIVHSHSTGIDTLDPIKREWEVQQHERVKKKFSVDMATDFWACSKAAADFLFGEQIPGDMIRIMPNAIDLSKFAYNQEIRSRYRREYGLENCFVIGHVGRFVYQKNHEFLIKVFYEVSKEICNARLVLLGEGELITKIQRQVEEYNLNNKVLFLGKRDDVNNWYQAMDVFCLPSRFEGLGIVLVEAQAAGLPCNVSLKVPNEADLSDNIVKLPLSVADWVRQILFKKDILERKDNTVYLMKAGYDIRDQVKIIQNFYGGGGKTI